MKKQIPVVPLLLLAATTLLLLSFRPGAPTSRFPYQKAGLTDREAAAHLLSRFSFGPRPGEVEAVAAQGLEPWFEAQLSTSLPDEKVTDALAGYSSLRLSNQDIVRTYPRPGQVLQAAIRDGVVNRDSAKVEKRDTKEALRDYMRQQGWRPQQELLRELAAQKIVRAVYSRNQVAEVLTDFWYNHFNVAASKGGVQQYLTAYERDAIRPHVLGKFESLLLATAQSPAMLIYLDNNKSTVDEAAMTEQQRRRSRLRDGMREKMVDGMMAADTALARNAKGKVKKPKMRGLNENYAREIMELHTLGVDGGYSQTDVTQAARILTGWGLNPAVEYNLKARQPNEQRMRRAGVVQAGDFVFNPLNHDGGEKKVLGQTFPAGGGYEEGLRLIHLLATHPSTARFISKKLAVRFVSDAPPASLVDKMAKTFLETEGDIKAVLRTMATAPEFWNRTALREKTKSPFEVAVSAVRATDATVTAPLQLYQWTAKMGQQLYNYQAPTGFPDRGTYWINTGSLLNRMNFGLALASNRIPGVTVNLPALNEGREPESPEDALAQYGKRLLPERNLTETLKRLSPLLNDPSLQQKVSDAAGQTATARAANEPDDEGMMARRPKGANKIGGKKNGEPQLALARGNNGMLGQVVGILLGSPEFQRR